MLERVVIWDANPATEVGSEPKKQKAFLITAFVAHSHPMVYAANSSGLRPAACQGFGFTYRWICKSERLRGHAVGDEEMSVACMWHEMNVHVLAYHPHLLPMPMWTTGEPVDGV